MQNFASLIIPTSPFLFNIICSRYSDTFSCVYSQVFGSQLFNVLLGYEWEPGEQTPRTITKISYTSVVEVSGQVKNKDTWPVGATAFHSLFATVVI